MFIYILDKRITENDFECCFPNKASSRQLRMMASLPDDSRWTLNFMCLRSAQLSVIITYQRRAMDPWQEKLKKVSMEDLKQTDPISNLVCFNC